MKDALGLFVGAVMALLAASFFDTPDSTVVNACKERGYWQTGQTRVICSVEN